MGVFNNLKLMILSLINIDNFKKSKINGFGWLVVILMLVVFAIYTAVVFRSGGPGYTNVYLFAAGSLLLSLAVIFIFSRIIGFAFILLGIIMMLSSIGMPISNIVMGYDFSWGHHFVYKELTTPFFANPIPYDNGTSIIPHIVWLISLLGGYTFGYIGLRLSLDSDTETQFVEIKAHNEAVEYEQELARQQYEEAEELANQTKVRKSKGGYKECRNCGATNWKGKRLAIAECNTCKTYFCKTCSGSKSFGGSQACPKCGSSSFKQKGFVEKG